MQLIAFIVLNAVASVQAIRPSTLREQVAFNLVRQHPPSTIRSIFENFEIKPISLQEIDFLLSYPKFRYAQFYADILESPERAKKLCDPAFMKETGFHRTIYSPEKLLNNPDMARAFFVDENWDPKKVVYVGEFAEAAGSGVDTSAAVERKMTLDQLTSRLSKMKMTKTVPDMEGCIYYAGNFLELLQFPGLIGNLYKTDRALAIHILDFVIEQQMGGMMYPSWINFLNYMEPRDQQWIMGKLAPREMLLSFWHHMAAMPQLLDFMNFVSQYLDERLPEDDLFVRCMVLYKFIPSPKLDACSCRFAESWNREQDLAIKLAAICERRADRSCRITLAQFLISAGLMDQMTILEQSTFYRLTPQYVECFVRELHQPLGKEFTHMKAVIPHSHLPIELLSTEDRLNAWLSSNLYKCVEEMKILKNQIDLASAHTELNLYAQLEDSFDGETSCDKAKTRVRVAELYVEGAREILAAPLKVLCRRDYHITLNAMGHLLAEGCKLDLSNFFAFAEYQYGEDWSSLLEKLESKNLISLTDDYSFFDSRLGIRNYLTLSEFRLQVDSSFQKP